jgi:hypothetical protein
MSLVNAVQSWRYCTNKGTRISCIAPVSTEEEKGTSQVRTFVHPKEKRGIGYIVTVPPDVKPRTRFPVKIEGQKEIYVRCPRLIGQE